MGGLRRFRRADRDGRRGDADPGRQCGEGRFPHHRPQHRARRSGWRRRPGEERLRPRAENHGLTLDGQNLMDAADQPGPDQLGLVVRGLMKSFRRRQVVAGVDLELRRGEAVGLLGPNGAGKTTTFYMITGLVAADNGRIEIDGRDVTRLPMYRRSRLGLGYLPQEASIFRGMSVEQNIMAVLELNEPDAAKRKRRLDELLDEFSMGRLRKSPATSLSGGERRRVEIARCLASDPSFVLLDEPFAGVDPIAVGDIRDLVKHLKNRGIGVLITDHNVRETLEIVDRAYILHDGQVLMSGSPADVVQDENVRRVYLGDSFRI
ncbi:MAG: LPS export ABC transporter ATP-binding protein [Pseudomonadota bacterium]